MSSVASAQSFDRNATEIILAPYLWGVAIDGTSTVGALPPLDIDASFGDIFSNLSFAMSLHTEFKNGPWVFVIDPTFLALEMEAGPSGGGPTVDMEVDIWLVEAWAGYQFHENWEVIGGARYQDQDISVSPGLPNPPFPDSISAGASWTD